MQPKAFAWIPLLATTVLLLPAALVSYLPMVDLPQHLAIVSMLEHHDDPAYGFSTYYEPAFDRTLYWLPYALVLALGRAMPLEAAMRCVVLLALALYPVGIVACLRALGKPAWLGLLALPLVYNQAFFWGFVNMSLAVGLAFLAWALLLRTERGPAASLAIAAISAAVVLTHGYGVAMVLGFVLLSPLFGKRQGWLRWAAPVWPAALGVVAWVWLAPSGEGTIDYAGLRYRSYLLPHAILGGWADQTELPILLLLAATFVVVSWRDLPYDRMRWLSLDPHVRTLYVFAAVNVLLYYGLPTHARAITIVNTRNALVAALVLPLLATAGGAVRTPRASRILVALLVFATIASSWFHLMRFDGEARDFDAVVERLPDRPRIASFAGSGRGRVAILPVYWHFAAYAQARKGGFITCTFPAVFWNIPVRLRDDAPAPDEPCLGPRRYHHRRHAPYFDHLLIRGTVRRRADELDRYGYELLLERPPWRLYAVRP